MKYIKRFIPVVIAVAASVQTMAQKKITEGTITYDYTVSGTSSTSTYTVYLKGNFTRTENVNGGFSSVTIHDAKTGSGVILKQVSGQKLLIRLTPENWKEKNSRYRDLQFVKTNETKTVAGYNCVKATAKTSEGLLITVYYTRELIPENKEYDPLFTNLDGLPMEYELGNESVKIRYSLASINLNPVAASRFDIPKSGYRELTYDESKRGN